MASDRPLSPHLMIYRWQISNTLSIIHRATGFAMSFGALALIVWLLSIANGYDAYSIASSLFGSILGTLALFGWTFCFFYHLCNGIRHMFWDIGKGFDKQVARQSGLFVVSAAIVLTVGLWAVVLIG